HDAGEPARGGEQPPRAGGALLALAGGKPGVVAVDDVPPAGRAGGGLGNGDVGVRHAVEGGPPSGRPGEVAGENVQQVRRVVRVRGGVQAVPAEVVPAAAVHGHVGDGDACDGVGDEDAVQVVGGRQVAA